METLMSGNEKILVVMYALANGFDLSALKDFAELLNAIIHAGNAELNVQVNSATLKLKILQQFIYLRIFLPVSVDNQPPSNAAGDIGIFGTKKAGKSALINALLGGEYAVSSPVLPTPNKVTYTAADKKAKEISLTYKNSAQTFRNVDALQKFLTEENSRANKNSTTLDEMTIALPDFPAFLNGARIIDTPASNFAASKGHANITRKTLDAVAHAVFVMNYSQYLTQDELSLFDEVYKKFNNAKVHRPILIVLNRVDEIFDSEESKSYERVADYIYYRLTALGYKNFLVVGVSAIQAVYFDNITKTLAPNPQGIIEIITKFLRSIFTKPIPLNEQLKKLKEESRGTDKFSSVVFVNNILTDFEDFYGVKVDNVRDLQKINRINYLKCLIQNLISGNIY